MKRLYNCYIAIQILHTFISLTKKNMAKYSGIDNLDSMEKAIKYNNYIFSQIKKVINKEDLVVEFGAGTGTFASRLKKAGFCKVECIEIDKKLKEKLKEKKLVVYDSIDQYKKQSIDIVYSLNVFEHLENDKEYMIKIFEKLKVKGKLLLYVPAFMLLYTEMDKKVGHLRRYNRRDINKMAIESGFKVIYSNYVDFLGFLFTLGYKVFLKKTTGGVNKHGLFLYELLFPINYFFNFLLKKLLGKNIFILLEKK